MIPNWLWFAPLAGLTALLAFGVFRLGQWSAQMTETDVILRASEQYLVDAAQEGQREADAATDCVALPGSGQVWIRVFCARGARSYIYDMTRKGMFLRQVHDGPRT